MNAYRQIFKVVVVLVIILIVASACVTPEENNDDKTFSYLVYVQREGTNETIKNAKVTIQVTGNTPLSSYTDNNGYARISVSASYAEKPGRLRVEAAGYESYWKEMSISKGVLPDMIYLVPKGDSNPGSLPTVVLPTESPVLPAKTEAVTFQPPTVTSSSSSSTLEATVATPSETSIVDGKGTTMLMVPAGEFLMGLPEEEAHSESDQSPQHRVYLNAFYIDLTEVTNAMYARCVQAEHDGCTLPAYKRSYTHITYYGVPDYADYPVIYVGWEQAKKYCEWRGARLPTEAEWEKAARGTDGRLYAWGNIFDRKRANICDDKCAMDSWRDSSLDDGYRDVAPVGSYPEGASPYGALDMIGNVLEWVADWYDPYYYASPIDWINPLGPDTEHYRVARGGAWDFSGYYLQVTHRYQLVPADKTHDLGFRCVRTP